ncbi:Cna B-type domain-containing protein [Vagococcus teuberi]|uniref:Gram-positive cocci surface proteins LPxTG domain-containing protein n=1 Tax=Vagococcus teuberi TaxID=519472 RepID=A0A1J0A813_9ENTE|nr:Cna B-type domain-containing protein [Vagococcus teuberi]APB32084.1 hypothetical protein BHY08_09845 [Vagococcus teuberi]
MKKIYIIMMLICFSICLVIKTDLVWASSNSEITGMLPEQNKNIDDRVPLVYGYEIKEDIVKLNSANDVFNISIIGDKENNMYFCLDERKYNPTDGELNTLEPSKQLKPEINWLSSNFYNNIENLKWNKNTPNKSGGNSPIDSFNKANFYNKYVYTQLAIWHFTNPTQFSMSRNVIKNNPEVIALINEANKNKNFYNPTYTDALNVINNIKYEATELSKESEDDDTYIFSTTIVNSGSTESFDVKDIKYAVSIEDKSQKRDVTKDVTITPQSNNKIYIQVPKKLLQESQSKLIVSASATVTSDKAFTTHYDNKNNKQPVLGGYKFSKVLLTEKSIEINDKTHYSVYKKWDDQNNQDGKRPKEITVQLYANNQKLGDPITLNANNNWQYTWNDLDAITNGKKIEYSVKELGEIEPYSSSITTDKDQLSTTITNSYSPEVTKISGEKVWDDQNNQDNKRPNSVTVNLLADGEEIDEKIVTPNSEGHWTYEFTNLPVYANGKKIVYSIAEDTVPDYSTEVNGTTITNSYTPGKTSVSVAKMWDDNNNQDNIRPSSIEVQLYKQTEKGKVAIGSVVLLDEKNNWSTTWSDLPLMDSGEKIKYTVEEVNGSKNIPGYTTTIDDDDHGNIIITNKHDVELTKIQGEKTWNDGNNQDGIRPDKITISLYANGVKTAQKIVTASDNWLYEFNDLPVYSQGEKINYTVQETPVEGYETKSDGVNITNTHTPETTTVTGSKSWHDQDNQDGIRPNKITAILYANGEEVDRQIVTEETNWVYTFTDLPKNSNGKEIEYTIKEIPVPGYDLTVNDINLLNTHAVDKTKISGTKTWDDDNNNDGKRPKSIIVYLYADGERIKQQEVTPDKSGVWSYEFDNLDKYKNGQEIKYTIQEEPIPHYETTINGTNLVNHYTSEVTDIKGIKTWNDANDNDGKRPKSITVYLIANGKPEAEKIVDETTNWEYSFTGLPVYKDGKKITYTVIEEPVHGYETSIDGYNITNTYLLEKTSVTVSKHWNDSNNQDGIRPQDISVQLYADGEESGKPVTLNEGNKWQYTWKELNKKKNGKTIEYTVKETNVPKGYNSTIANNDNGNIIITNSHEPEKTEVSGKKTWDDANNQDGKRPESIKVNLLANGSQVDSKTVTEKDNWAYTFSHLDKYKNGEPIVYTVSEDSVPDYTVSMKDNNITNSYTPGKTSVTVSKHWNDANNQDGIRPQDISVQLYADGKESGKPVTLNKGNKWQYTWKELDEKKNGKTIEYTVKETNVPKGYNSTITNNDNGNIIITNSHEPEKTEVSGKKTWDDANNQDGKRPESIKVNLLANGVKVDSKTVTEKDNWAYTFSHLDKYENGEPIVYTVSEDRVSDYTVSMKDNNITNSYTPGKTSVTVSKHWNDANNQDGIRPQDISVQLYADGKESGKPVTLNEGNKWQYTWKELDEKKNGKTIEYTVKEINVPKGYTATVTDDGKGHLTLTNSHNVSKVPGTSGSGTTNNNKSNLPSTGEGHSMSPIFYGAGILLMSMGAFYIRRKH